MAVTIEQSPLGQVLAQGIQSIPEYRNMGYQRNLSERQQQMAEEQWSQTQKMNQIQMIQMQEQLSLNREANLMDAAGYQNPVNKYFQDLKYQKGKFASNPSVPGGWEWTGSTAMPNEDEAWLQYQLAAGGMTNAQDKKLFEQKYNDAMTSRANRVITELSRLRDTGHSDDDINYILSQNMGGTIGNQQFGDMISKVYNWEGLQQEHRTLLKPFLKKKSVSTTQMLTEAAKSLGGGALGAGGAVQFIEGRQRAGLEAEGKERFKKRSERTKTKLDAAKKELEKAKKSKAKNKASRVEKLTQKVKDLNSKWSKDKMQLSNLTEKHVKANRFRAKAFNMLKKPFPSTLAATYAGDMLGSLGDRIGGTKGQAYGQLTGAGIQGGLGGYRMLKGLYGTGSVLKNLLWRVPTAVGGAATDLASPAMDFAMASWLLAGAKSDWDKSMKSFDRARAGR